MLKISVVVGVRSVFNRENFFQLFHLEEEFLIDLVKLDDVYVRFYDVLNSHLLESTSEVEKEFLSSYLSMINNGYDTLKDDMKRAEHLLLQNNIAIPNPSQAFLSSVFDVHCEDIKGMKIDIKSDMVAAFSRKDFENAALLFPCLTFSS